MDHIRDSSLDYGRDISNNYGRESARNFGREMPNSYGRQMSNSSGREMSNSYGREMTNSYGKESTNSYGREMPKSYGRENSVDSSYKSKFSNNSNYNSTSKCFNIYLVRYSTLLLKTTVKNVHIRQFLFYNLKNLRPLSSSPRNSHRFKVLRSGVQKCITHNPNRLFVIMSYFYPFY